MSWMLDAPDVLCIDLTATLSATETWHVDPRTRRSTEANKCHTSESLIPNQNRTKRREPHTTLWLGSRTKRETQRDAEADHNLIKPATKVSL